MPKFLDAPSWYESGTSGNAVNAEAFAVPTYSLNTESAMEFLIHYPDNCDFIIYPSVQESSKSLYLDSMVGKYLTVNFEEDSQPIIIQKRTRYYLESSINPTYRISYTVIGAYPNVTEPVTTLGNSVECTIFPGSIFSVYTNDNTNWRVNQQGVMLNGGFVKMPSIAPTFYAPTTGGITGQILTSQGVTSAPSWVTGPVAHYIKVKLPMPNSGNLYFTFFDHDTTKITETNVNNRLDFSTSRMLPASGTIRVGPDYAIITNVSLFSDSFTAYGVSFSGGTITSDNYLRIYGVNEVDAISDSVLPLYS